MKYIELFQEQNEQMRERYELVMERIQLMLTEDSVKGTAREYFRRSASFLLKVQEIAELVLADQLRNLTEEELRIRNEELYLDLIGKNYEISFANPNYAVEQLGEKNGKLLCFCIQNCAE